MYLSDIKQENGTHVRGEESAVKRKKIGKASHCHPQACPTPMLKA
jgi:hypothetical protein